MKIIRQIVPKLENGESNYKSKNWPYLWCHVCDDIKHDAIRIFPDSNRLQDFGICLECLGMINEAAKTPHDGL